MTTEGVANIRLVEAKAGRKPMRCPKCGEDSVFDDVRLEWNKEGTLHVSATRCCYDEECNWQTTITGNASLPPHQIR